MTIVQQVCQVKEQAIHWKYKGIKYEIFISKDKVFMWNPTKFNSYTQLYFRCPSCNQFPLDIFQSLSAEMSSSKVGEILTISFKTNANKEVIAKTQFSQSPTLHFSIVEVLCRRLLLIHSSEKEEDKLKQTQANNQWILYIHSELAFFAFGNSYLHFGASMTKPPLTISPAQQHQRT